MRIDPNDLPKHSDLYCVQFEKWTTTYITYYRPTIEKWQIYNLLEAQRKPIVDDYIDSEEVIAWCELPKFEGVDMTELEKKQRHREIARESARRKNGYYEREHKGKKEVRKPVVDLSNFDIWYEMNYIKGQNIQPPKVITFKEHIRVLCERDNQYENLLSDYNKLVEAYNELVKELEE